MCRLAEWVVLGVFVVVEDCWYRFVALSRVVLQLQYMANMQFASSIDHHHLFLLRP
jgi:hypothetical protein